MSTLQLLSMFFLFYSYEKLVAASSSSHQTSCFLKYFQSALPISIKHLLCLTAAFLQVPPAFWKICFSNVSFKVNSGACHTGLFGGT